MSSSGLYDEVGEHARPHGAEFRPVAHSLGGDRRRRSQHVHGIHSAVAREYLHFCDQRQSGRTEVGAYNDHTSLLDDPARQRSHFAHHAPHRLGFVPAAASVRARRKRFESRVLEEGRTVMKCLVAGGFSRSCQRPTGWPISREGSAPGFGTYLSIHGPPNCAT